MWQERIRRYLLTDETEKAAGFREDIQRLSRSGLRVAGGVEIGVSAFMVAANLLLDPRPELVSLRLWMCAQMVTLGLLTIAATRVEALQRYARAIGCLSALLSSLLLTWFYLGLTQFDSSAHDFIPGNMTLIMLVAVAALPLRPVQTLYLGGLMLSGYVILAMTATELHGGPGVSVLFVVYMFMLTILASSLSAVVYNQRRSTWELHASMMQASENIRQSEARNLLAQNAASVGRLAAAISHELNSPVGALVSGVDTLLLLAARQAMCGGNEQEQQRLVLLQNDLRKTIRDSTDRLKAIVARMQRFTNLDKAEIQEANINDILSDVAALLEPTYKDRTTVDLDLRPVPQIVCRPQQLSAVFSSLLGNAVEATNGGGRVLIATRNKESEVEVAFEDNGRGLDSTATAAIFDPGFKVTSGRVSTGNWSMFSSRQIIREHGGDIRISSRPGKGTRVSVTLPVGSELLT